MSRHFLPRTIFGAALLFASSAWAETPLGLVPDENAQAPSRDPESRGSIAFGDPFDGATVVDEGPAGRDRPRETVCKPCPFGCNDAGFSLFGCREFKSKDGCCIAPKDRHAAPLPDIPSGL